MKSTTIVLIVVLTVSLNNLFYVEAATETPNWLSKVYRRGKEILQINRFYTIDKLDDGHYSLTILPPADNTPGAVKKVGRGLRSYVLVPIKEYYKNGASVSVKLPKMPSRLSKLGEYAPDWLSKAFNRGAEIFKINRFYNISRTEDGHFIINIQPPSDNTPGFIKKVGRAIQSYVLVPMKEYYKEGGQVSVQLPKIRRRLGNLGLW